MTTGDRVLIALVLVAAIAGLFLVPAALGSSGPAVTVIVEVDGELRERLPLAKDSQTLIEARDGYCRLEIRDGRAKITESDCPKNFCIDQAAVGSAGGIIVCLPHKIVVSAGLSGQTTGALDAVVR